jgi:hypothetical protein
MTMKPRRMLSIKNFRTFQHYKDRNPPWIKLYTALLEDYDFLALSDAARSQLMLIWLVAARMGGSVPDDPKWIAATIHCTSPLKLRELLASGFLISAEQDASQSLGECMRDASIIASTPLSKVEHATTRDAREEAEAETEGETETHPPPRATPRTAQDARHAELMQLIPSNRHADLETALAECDRVGAMTAELLGFASDAGGTGRTYTGAQIGSALHDWVANGDHRRFNARQLLRYVEGARASPAGGNCTANSHRHTIVDRVFLKAQA